MGSQLQALHSKSARGRLQARLEKLREDEKARDELASRVAAWRGRRTDGRAAARNFVSEREDPPSRRNDVALCNSLLVPVPLPQVSENRLAMSQVSPRQQMEAKLASQRSHRAMQLTQHRERYQFIVAEQERQRVMVAAELQEELGRPSLAKAMRDQLGAAPLDPSGMGSGVGGSLYESMCDGEADTGHGAVLKRLSSSSGAKFGKRRSLSAQKKETAARATRWRVLAAIGHAQSTWADALFWDRNNRDYKNNATRAATVIQRRQAYRVLRVQLARLRRSMILLRRNMLLYTMRWRARKKDRCMHVLVTFLRAHHDSTPLRTAMRKFLYQVVRVQRLWRLHWSHVSAQLGLLTVQFDNLVKTRKSPEAFLTPDVGQGHTRTAPRAERGATDRHRHLFPPARDHTARKPPCAADPAVPLAPLRRCPSGRPRRASRCSPRHRCRRAGRSATRCASPRRRRRRRRQRAPPRLRRPRESVAVP